MNINFNGSNSHILFPSYISRSQINRVKERIKSNFFLENLEQSNIFYTEDLENKLVKQFQHLESFEDIKEIGIKLLEDFQIDGEIKNMQLFIKHPNYKITRPHQDGAYFQSDRYVTFWIPLQDVDETNSCLYYLNGSHVCGLLNHKESGSVVRTRTGAKGLSLEYDHIELNQYTPVIMKKGDMICHHPYTLHYSSSNMTDKPRYALACIIKLNNI